MTTFFMWQGETVWPVHVTGIKCHPTTTACVNTSLTYKTTFRILSSYRSKILSIGGAQQPKLDSRKIPPSAGQPREPARPSGVVLATQVRRLSYLIGKTVTKDILDGNGDVVVRAECDSHRVLDLMRMVDLASE
ncbi:MAG: hypothetical protein NT140_07005 [Deltaproteobacteria bacterium]|nr:hypothetical protein [Deltaproteobacteria bacterium]